MKRNVACYYFRRIKLKINRRNLLVVLYFNNLYHIMTTTIGVCSWHTALTAHFTFCYAGFC